MTPQAAPPPTHPAPHEAPDQPQPQPAHAQPPQHPAKRRDSGPHQTPEQHGPPTPRRSLSAPPCPASGPAHRTRYVAPNPVRIRPPQPTPSPNSPAPHGPCATTAQPPTPRNPQPAQRHTSHLNATGPDPPAAQHAPHPTATAHSWHPPRPTRAATPKETATNQPPTPRTPKHTVAVTAFAHAFLSVPERSRPPDPLQNRRRDPQSGRLGGPVEGGGLFSANVWRPNYPETPNANAPPTTTHRTDHSTTSTRTPWVTSASVTVQPAERSHSRTPTGTCSTPRSVAAAALAHGAQHRALVEEFVAWSGRYIAETCVQLLDHLGCCCGPPGVCAGSCGCGLSLGVTVTSLATLAVNGTVEGVGRPALGPIAFASVPERSFAFVGAS